MVGRFILAALLLPSPALAGGEALAAAAREQVGVTLIYDGSYQGLAFPGGDIARLRGVCSDVVVRALRDAWQVDLQLAVNRDMKAAFAKYPKIWGLKTTDRNIDHRRVPNLEVFFRRIGAEMALSSDPAAFAPGDIVSWRLEGSNLPHIGIVAEGRSRDGARPLVTHNIGWGTQTEDMLFDHRMIQHVRITPEALARLEELGR
ncbi:DUF1287 domain-containing protein [Alphaproteobacteria bacterium KMM 3653]|uniref:DUF1287 domain-containing protein n=1 Tax=Harenicola maris TaxID=2841044 RepID=A0AAP2CQE8_9RHOB|nr:DUF1287 domain-containing protein [Harenicola maris]